MCVSLVGIGDSLMAGLAPSDIYEKYKRIYPEQSFVTLLATALGLTAGANWRANFVYPEPIEHRCFTLTEYSFLYDKPYNLLGFPSLKIEDLFSIKMQADITGDELFDQAYRDYFRKLLRNNSDDLFSETTPMEQILLLSPDILIFWLGSNNVLLPIAQGCVGKSGEFLDSIIFKAYLDKFFSESLSMLPSLKIIALTIPDFLQLPFLNEGKQLITFSNLYGFDELGDVKEIGREDLITMMGILPFENGFGTKKKPLPSSVWLTKQNLKRVRTVIDEYNFVIKSQSSNERVSVFDVNDILYQIKSKGYFEQDTFRVAFDTSGSVSSIFVGDKIHLSSKGHIILAKCLKQLINE